MPQKDGTGPGSGRGKGQGLAGKGRGQGRGGQCRFGGLGGKCICPVCGETKIHTAGMPCIQESCPKCGAKMVRDHGQRA